MTHLLGIDTGGTYTDAVIVDDALHVLASSKALTTRHDLAEGVRAALEAVLARAPGTIGLVSLSTTLATNALVEGQGSPIGLLLIGYERAALERAGLAQALGGDPVAFIPGGHRADGSELEPLDLAAARAAILAQAPRVSAFAVSGMFAVRNPAHEQALRALVRELAGLPVSCGHELASALDAPRRALTAALNARLIPLLDQLIRSVRGMLAERGIAAPLMVVKGDGSLIRAELALECPVETILSGPAASVVGAHFLAGSDEARADDMIVADMGGTTTDVAILQRGRPRLNPDGALVGGWRTMVEAVQVHTYGLGGDSRIRLDPHDGLVAGPRRVLPLALLGARYPETVEALRLQLAAPQPARETGEFALRLRALGGYRLSPAQAKLWTRLERGPLALAELLDDHTLARPLERLVERGLVALAGFTPSDAAHVLGCQAHWSVEAARLGAELWRRRAQRELGLTLADADAFARHAFERVAVQAGRAIATSALAERKGEVWRGLPAGARELIDAALERRSDGLLGVRLTLEQPLVAIGAPAATWYPEVAERLGARLRVPEHAAIANALGAVVGGVAQKAVAHITPDGDERFHVHIASGLRDFPTLDAAVEYALAETSRLAAEQARRAGAEGLELRTAREDTVGRNDFGLELFFESVITATAWGRPRIARG